MKRKQSRTIGITGLFAVLCLALLVGCASKVVITEESIVTPGSSETKSDPPVYVGYVPDFESMTSFQRMVSLDAGTTEHENERIEYLLERVASTPYDFVRNGETHGGSRAAIHLRYKWAKYREEAPRAEDYVKNVASGSRATGRPYYLKIGSKYHLMENVLYNELNLLEQGLNKYRQKQMLLEARKEKEESEINEELSNKTIKEEATVL